MKNKGRKEGRTKLRRDKAEQKNCIRKRCELTDEKDVRRE